MQISCRPPLNPLVTAGCLILVALELVGLTFALLHGGRTLTMIEPERAVATIGEVNLLLDESVRYASPVERRLYRFLGPAGAELRGQILGAYLRVHKQTRSDYQEDLEDSDSRQQVSTRNCWVAPRVAFFQAEAGAWKEIDEWEAKTGHEEAAYVAALRVAFSSPGALDLETAGWRNALRDLHHHSLDTSWTEETLGLRLADADALDFHRARLEQACLPMLRRTRVVNSGYLLVILAGIGVLALRPGLFLKGADAARGVTVPPWSFQYGVEVILRCAGAGILVQCVLFVAAPQVCLNFSSILTAIPMLFIANTCLCRPDGRTLADTFGISFREMSPGRLIPFALGLSAINLLGSLVIQGGAAALSVESSWEDFVFEPLFFGTFWEATFLTVDGVVGAPVMEEVAFRGVVYVTLRSRYKASVSAVASSLLFSVLHVYSVVGFLEVFWFGVVLAYGYEKSRSLIPCIFAHFVNNFLFFSAFWLLYR